ncbi:MAG: ATP-binding protein, partial [Verrucomicrobia bacterium]|nr:ATP-binding protein [Verrucomicrobiota bacterium]
MIITNSRQKPSQSAEFEEKQFSIRLNPKLFEALGSLYTDPILALCREYMTNADEAHQLAGHNRPIEVTLPTKLAPEFIIRDQGPGLPKEKLFELFTTYGASGDEKETSNDYEGGFGLGGKCWRAYADSIIVESCHNGTKTTYSFFLDETNMGKAAILATEPSRSSGITIKVPVKKEDIDTFTNRAANIAWMFPVRPRFTNLTDAQLEEHVDEDLKFGERKPIYRETRYVFFGDSKKSFVRMGRLLYPIGTSHLPSNFNVLLKNLIESGIVLELNVG